MRRLGTKKVVGAKLGHSNCAICKGAIKEQKCGRGREKNLFLEQERKDEKDDLRSATGSQPDSDSG